MSEAVDMGGDYLAPAHGHNLPVAKYQDNGKWRAYAKCRDQDRSVFFVEGSKGVSVKALNAAKEIALLICAECPVRLRCLNYAVRNDEHNGIWGGVDFAKLKRDDRNLLIDRLDKLNVR